MNKRTIVLAQIGCGYWGPNLLRNFSAVPDCRVKYVVEASPERREYVQRNFPQSEVLTTADRVLADAEVDGVIIATPAHAHFEMGLSALRAGKHIFVEKPLATKVTEVDRLAAEAQRQGRIVMAGHTFLYNEAVRYIKKLIDEGELGDIRYIYSQRLNLGRIRSDIDALWNFAPHDISIIQYWLGDVAPLTVARFGMAYMQPKVDDVVFLNLTYPGKIMANIHVSWLDPQKVRKMVIVGSRKMVIYDDTAEDKIAICDKGIDRKAVLGENMDFDVRPPAFAYREGTVAKPAISIAEPLQVEARHFADCIRNGSAPLTGIDHARSVVGILEQAGGHA